MSTTTSTTLSLKAGIPPKLLLGGNRIDKFEIYRGVGVDPDLENDEPHHTSPRFPEGEFPADFDDENVTPGETYHYVVKLIRSLDDTFSTSRVFKITASGAYDLGYPNNFPDPDSGVPFFTLVEPVLHLRADVEIGRKGEDFIYTGDDILTNEADSWQSLNYNFTGFQLKYWRTFGDALRMENNLAGQYTDWLPGSNYSSGDKVGYNYIAYKAKEDITSSTTPPPEDPDNWTEFGSSIETNIPVFTRYKADQQEISSTDLLTLGQRRLASTGDYSFFSYPTIMYGGDNNKPAYKPFYDDFINYFNDKNQTNSVTPKKPLGELETQEFKKQLFVLDEGVTYFAVFPNRPSVSTYKPRYKISELLSENYSGTTNVMATGKVYEGDYTYDTVSQRVLNYYFDFTGVFDTFTSVRDAQKKATGFYIIIYHEDGFHEILPLQTGLHEEPLLDRKHKLSGYLHWDVHGSMSSYRLGSTSLTHSAMISQNAYDNHPQNRQYLNSNIPGVGKTYSELTLSEKAQRRTNERLNANVFPNPAGGFTHLPNFRPEGLHAIPPSGGLYYELISQGVQNLNKAPNFDDLNGTKSSLFNGGIPEDELELYNKRWSDGDPWIDPNPPFGKADPSRPNFYCPAGSAFNDVHIGPGLYQSTGATFQLGGHQGFVKPHGPGYILNDSGQPFAKFNKDSYKVANNKLNVLVYTYDPNSNSGKGRESIFINGSLVFQNDSSAAFDMGDNNYWKSQGFTESNFVKFNRPPIFSPETRLNLAGTQSFCELINYHKFLDRSDFNRVIYYIKAKYGEDGFLSTQSNYNGLY
jgi:hypothetical protein